MAEAPRRVLVCGRLPDDGRQALESADLEIEHLPDREAGSLADIIAPFVAVIVHSPHRVDAEALEAASLLKVVGRAGVGVDNIDVETATARGVLVMNLPWGNTVTAAEHTMAMLMAMARNIPQSSAALKQGIWDRATYLGVELKDKTLGIIGLGRIGREVARRARGMEMVVVGSDPFLSPSVARDLGIELVSTSELLPRADFLTLHVPKTDDTQHLIDAEAIASMKPGARLVNCARGGLVDEAALLAALEAGQLAGAAFDVYETEPTDNTALVAHPSFVGTPHLGGATHEARQRVGAGIARQVADYLTDGLIRHGINVQALPPDEQRAMEPYLQLGGQLGALLSQCFENIERLRIEYHGELTSYTLRPLSAHILAGYLRPFLGDQVNVVNAAAIACQRGLGVDESKSTSERGYESLIRVTALTEDGQHSVAGTVFDGARGRLVELGRIPVETTLEGHLLVLENEDRPGVVGQLGTFLAKRGINIADMSLGRDEPRGTAIIVLAMDQLLDSEGLQDLLALSDIHWARVISF